MKIIKAVIRKLICVLSVLVLCCSMGLPAYADVKEDSQNMQDTTSEAPTATTMTLDTTNDLTLCIGSSYYFLANTNTTDGVAPVPVTSDANIARVDFIKTTDVGKYLFKVTAVNAGTANVGASVNGVDCIFTFNAINPASASATTGPTVPTRDVYSLVKASIIYGTMVKSINGFTKGQKVEVISDQNYGKSYKVSANGRSGYIAASAVSIPNDPATNTNKLSASESEYYVNMKGFASDSTYFCWVDIDRQQLYVFTGSKGKWKLYKNFSCATGINKMPTPRGQYTPVNRGLSFGDTQSEGAKYYVRFSGSYMIHSLPYQYGKIVDYTLGKRASHGCVRLSVGDAIWFYKTIPAKTTIWVN